VSEMRRLLSHFRWGFRELHHCSCEGFFGWGKQVLYLDYGTCAHCGKWMSGRERIGRIRVRPK
jgi:hypothetical protein